MEGASLCNRLITSAIVEMSNIAQHRFGFPRNVTTCMREGTPMTTHGADWASIAKQASVEMNPAKLTILVEQLCIVLDRRNEAVAPTTPDDQYRTVGPSRDQ